MDERRRRARLPSLFGRRAVALQSGSDGCQSTCAQHPAIRRCHVRRASRLQPDLRGLRQRVELHAPCAERSELPVSREPWELVQAQRRQQPDRGHGRGGDRCQSGNGWALGQLGPWSRRDRLDIRRSRPAAGDHRYTFPGVSGAPHTYGLMDVNVDAPPNAPPGDYSFQVKATDRASNVTLNTTVPVRILACKPTKICSTIGLHMCGPVSNGCGGTADCGASATGVCSNGFVVPKARSSTRRSTRVSRTPARRARCIALRSVTARPTKRAMLRTSRFAGRSWESSSANNARNWPDDAMG